ncbi:MAG: VanZ family protein, partial [Bifidobacteriaceae bacterium]|nr:VanZ family protein [Bifidobacteriaceae bacterium]
MNNVELPAVAALVAGLLLCLVGFVPFVAVSYRHRGGLTAGRTLAWVAAAIYAMALWAYTLLPLPAPGELRCVGKQLRPFAWVSDFFHYPHGPAQLIHNPVLLQVGLNVVLFLPLGFFIRLLAHRGVAAALVTGFGTSLLIELTQLTGVWGAYSCAYRLFDVDDLMVNTAGAVLGSLAALAVPSLRHHAWAAPVSGVADRPAPVTKSRRFVAMACDLLGCGLVATAVTTGLQAFQLYVEHVPAAELRSALARAVGWLIAWCLEASVIVATGASLGDHATQLRYRSLGKGPATVPGEVGRCVARVLGGMGGFCLLMLLPSGVFAWALAAVCVIAAVATRHGRGLPGLLGHQELTDARGEPAGG